MSTRYTDRRIWAASDGARPATTVQANRTVIYCRISLDAAGQGLGVERQEQECRSLCERNGWTVDAVLVDNDMSATTGKRRPAFEELLADPPTRIVTWHTDRLVRLTEELDRVIKLEVPVHTVTAGDLDLATPAGRAVARTITAWARYEGEQKSLRQKSSHRQRAGKGKPFWSHRRPFGFEPKGAHNKAEADALRHCFAMVQEGQTFAACAAYLTAAGFTTTRGSVWRGPGLSVTMRHPRNAGLVVYQDEIVGQGQWEPIVSEEEWRSILSRSESLPQAKAAIGGGDKIKSLLGGIGVCGQCGAKLRQTWQQSVRRKGKADEHRVRTRVYQPACHHVAIDADWLDDLVSKAALREASHPARALRDGRPVQPAEAQEAAANAVALRSRLEDVARREALDELTAGQARTMTETLRERLGAAEAKAVSFYSANPLDRAYSPAGLLTAWRSNELSLQHKREAVLKYLARVSVRPRLNRNERANADMVTIEHAT